MLLHLHFIHILLTECYYTFNYKDNWDPGLFTCYTMTYFINFVTGVNPPMSEAHCGCTSFHEYVITKLPTISIQVKPAIQWVALIKTVLLE